MHVRAANVRFRPIADITGFRQNYVMTTLTLGGHAIEFADCRDLGQGGPDTCTMSINGEPVVGRLVRLSSFLWGHLPSLRFHPSPLEFEGDILVPMWGRPKSTLCGSTRAQ
jgi:hypothetical protein